MSDLNAIVDSLSSLTVMEAAELAKLLEEKWGVSAAAPVAVAAGGGGAGEAVAEEKVEFDVILISQGDKKIQVIKEVRAITGLVTATDRGRDGPSDRFACRAGPGSEGDRIRTCDLRIKSPLLCQLSYALDRNSWQS